MSRTGFIDHIGLVYPSGFLPLVVGDVRKQSLVDIYRDSPIMKQLRDNFEEFIG